MLRVELIYDKDCPNVKKARTQLLQSFYAANVQPKWKEWDRSATDTPTYALAYGSPTILVNGEDVVGTSPSEGINCCRLYLDKNGQFQGVPSVEEISLVLLRASSVAGSGIGRQSNWRRILATLPAIFIALLPSPSFLVIKIAQYLL